MKVTDKQKFVKQVSPPPPSEVVAAAFEREIISEFDTRKEKVLGSPTPVESIKSEEEEEQQQDDDFELDDKLRNASNITNCNDSQRGKVIFLLSARIRSQYANI